VALLSIDGQVRRRVRLQWPGRSVLDMDLQPEARIERV